LVSSWEYKGSNAEHEVTPSSTTVVPKLGRNYPLGVICNS